MTEYFIWLNLCFFSANKKTDIILNEFNILDFYERIQKGEKFDFLNEKDYERINLIKIEKAIEIKEKTLNLGFKIICYGDEKYPENFNNLENKPVCIYVDGSEVWLNKLCIGVIGSRDVSDYALYAAANISYNLASSGACVVSGFAMGADSAAHIGALYAKGSTIAVLGCGLDRQYPKSNEFYQNKISQNGCRISEYPIGTEPFSWHFPKRNRLIAALCDGIFVAQAREKSGALITVNFALDLGKDIFVIPDNIFDAHSKGSVSLSKDGASIIYNAKDILNEYLHNKKYNIKIENITEDNPINFEFIEKYIKRTVNLKADYNKIKPKTIIPDNVNYNNEIKEIKTEKT
ncbi:MAG: DNA-processing protein DprA, partial [Oscillospiraceae bacterium]